MIVDFQKFLEKHQIDEKEIAVGVSGGSDSLALVFLAHEQLYPLGYKIIALTVDHGLRPSSAKEAQYVKTLMTNAQIEHHTLIWQGEKPVSGIEEAAREARYNLISKWCHDHQINSLFIAHHQEDQAETFLMRLERGSGLDGLCGIRESSNWGDLKILRPLLQSGKEELQNYLLQKGIHWVEDESNQCDDFLRVRMRKFLPEFCERTGISIENICSTMDRLQASQSFLAQTAEQYIQRHFKSWLPTCHSCSLHVWNSFHPEMKFRVLSSLLKQSGGQKYTPRASGLLALIERLSSSDFKSATLGSCEIMIFDQHLWIVPQTISSKHYSKEKWKAFLEKNPSLKRRKIPYKLRLLLTLQN